MCVVARLLFNLVWSVLKSQWQLVLVSHRYDSFTGVPVCQQNLSLEKASILFNMAALYSQVGTRSNRQTIGGLEEAISSFQKAAGRNGDRWKNRIQQTDVKHHNMPSFVQASDLILLCRNFWVLHHYRGTEVFFINSSSSDVALC